MLALAAVVACTRTEKEPVPEPPAKTSGSPLVLAPPGVRIVKAPAGDNAATLIKAERERTMAESRDLLVYVGAKWCEPCQRFHHAAAEGKLDNEFPNLTVMEFDLDVDRDRIVAAGYASQFIPLFVVPDADGHPTDKRVEGGIKGEAAVLDLTKKLRPLFAQK
ncbi:MAG: thioredoxin family protein [Labilithrix sp.]|nr:thioredoxin family protein [Labilithrix sp.]MCW5816656.1 thioredoxin family protein [Labilithrix sp.]